MGLVIVVEFESEQEVRALLATAGFGVQAIEGMRAAHGDPRPPDDSPQRLAIGRLAAALEAVSV